MMNLIDCNGLLNSNKNSMSDKSNIFSTLLNHEIDNESNEKSKLLKMNVLSSISKQNDYNLLAICNSCILSIFKCELDNDSKYELISELEFDYELQVISWDKNGQCIIIGDSNGSLHFITSTGSLIFSRRVIPNTNHINNNISFLYIGFICLNDTDTSPCLITMFDNGNIIGISKVPINLICSIATSQPQLLASALQKLQFLQCNISKDADISFPLKKSFIYSLDIDSTSCHLNTIFIDNNNKLLHVDIGTNLDLSCDNDSIMSININNGVCNDFILLPILHSGLINNIMLAVLINNSVISLLDLFSKDKVITSSTNLDNNMDLFILSTNTIEDYDNNNSDILLSYLLTLVNTTSNKSQIILIICRNDKNAKMITLETNEFNHHIYPSTQNLINNLTMFLHCYDNMLICLQYCTDIIDIANSINLGYSYKDNYIIEQSDDGHLHSSIIVGNILFYSFNCNNDKVIEILISKLDTIVEILYSFASCINVLAIINCLIDSNIKFYDGFFSYLLNNALIAIERIGAFYSDKLMNDVIIRVQLLIRILDKSNNLICYSNQNLIDNNEVKKMYLLSKYSNLSKQINSWKILISQGYLKDANFLRSKISDNFNVFDVNNNIDLVEIIKSIPTTASIEDIITFYQLNVLSCLEFIPRNINKELIILKLATTLCSKVDESNELIDTQSFEILATVEMASNLCRLIQPISQFQKDEINKINLLLHNLKIKSSISKVWGLNVSLSDVYSIGLEGFLYNKLWKLFINDMISEVDNVVKPIINEYKLNLDDILVKWIEDAVTNRIITISSTDLNGSLESDYNSDDNSAYDDDDDDKDKISRLIIGVSLINDITKRSKSILLLFQVPSLDKSIMNPIIASISAFNNFNLDNRDNNTCADALSLLSSNIYNDVEISIKDELKEAVRLHRIKMIAQNYGISSFDPRDIKQVRAAVILISSRNNGLQSIKDSIDFVEGWSSCTVDITSILSRAISFRFTQISLEYDNDNELVKLINLIPTSRLMVVIEDACMYLIDIINNLVNKSKTNGKISGSLTDADDENTAKCICKGAISITSIYIDSKYGNKTATSFDESNGLTWVNIELLSSLKILRSLQLDYNLYLSLNNLRNSSICKSIISILAEKRVSELVLLWNSFIDNIDTSNEISLLTPVIRRICSLLSISLIYFLHTIMKILLNMNEITFAMHVAKQLSSDEYTGSSNKSISVSSLSSSDTALLIDASIILCSLASKYSNKASLVRSSGEKSKPVSGFDSKPTNSLLRSNVNEDIDIAKSAKPFQLASKLLKNVSISCPIEQLSYTINILSGADLVVSVFDRIESTSTTTSSSSINNNSSNNNINNNSINKYKGNEDTKDNFKIFNSLFRRDGILMSSNTVFKPLINYILHEIKRRSSHSTNLNSGNNANASDVEELVAILQRSENHMLAERVLYSTWHISKLKGNLIRTSILTLCRQILSYRNIDISLSVSCLVVLPYELMVKELKAAVPSIQSDFSRLRTVAIIGEELARLWNEDSLLNIFQGIQTNARWWHILSSIGVKVDPRAFQSSDPKLRETCVRSVIKPLLEKSNLNLEKALEYCSQFHIEPEFASICYIEMIILQAPTSISDNFWLKQVRNASLNVNEDTMLVNLRKLLPQVNPLDYEKIRFVCTWIIDILIEEDENMNDLSDISIIDSDDLTGGSNHGGLTISMSRKQSNDINSTKSNTIMEIDLCRSYIDITSFLSGIVFPMEVINQITSISEIYNDITSLNYLTRLPLWSLINEPWEIIESIMKSSPNIASKLYPLCHPLLLNKDEFIIRKIKAIYNNKEGNILNKNIATDKFEMVSEMVNGISDFKQRLNIWKWLYTKEKGVNNIIAEKAITTSLQLLTTSIPVNSDHITINCEEIDSLMTSLINDLVAIRCEFTIINLDNKVSNIFNNYINMSSLARIKSSYNNPNILLQNLLEILITRSWSLQLQSLRYQSEILCSDDILNQIHTPLVVKYLKYVSIAIKEIVLHNSMLTTTEVVKDKEDINNLETIRHSMIGKFLSDLDNNTNNSKTNSNNTSSLWGEDTNSSILICTLSELRRREDIFLSFSISVLISSCDSIEVRSSYITQLNTVYRGQSIRSMRRLTSRSKFRAIQAINFLNIGNEYELLSTITGDKLCVDNINDSSLLKLDKLKLYLYCLSELQELRLPCSEETLLMSLGLLDNGLKHDSHICNPSPLIKTWIYDEGNHIEVIDLSRDLLIVCDINDISIWENLLNHMDQKSQLRNFFVTLVIIRNKSIFLSLCRNQALLSLIMKIVMKCCVDIINKIDITLDKMNNNSNIDIKELNNTNNTNNTNILSKHVQLIELNDNNYNHVVFLDGEKPEDIILVLLQIKSLWWKLIPLVTKFDLLNDMENEHLLDCYFNFLKISTNDNNTNSSNNSRNQICINSEACAYTMLDGNYLSNVYTTVGKNNNNYPLYVINGLNLSSEACLIIKSFQTILNSSNHIWKLFQQCVKTFDIMIINEVLNYCILHKESSKLLEILLLNASCSWDINSNSYNSTITILRWCLNSFTTYAIVSKTIISQAITILNNQEKKNLGSVLQKYSKKLNINELNNIKIFVSIVSGNE